MKLKLNSHAANWVIRLVIAIALAWVAFRYWPSDTRRIHRQTKSLFAALSKSGAESMPRTAAKTLEVGQWLAPTVTFDLGPPFPDHIAKQDLVRIIQVGRARIDGLKIIMRGYQALRPGPDELWLDVTLDAILEAEGGRTSMIGTYRLIWKRSDKKWLLHGIEAVNVIAHPNALVP